MSNFYKKRCKDCCYMYKTDGNDYILYGELGIKGEWCCECYEKLCRHIFKCPQVDDIDEVKYLDK